jgi:catechol 2,3-dioxygenase-like lactoylglutathione lyase family enzyme
MTGFRPEHLAVVSLRAGDVPAMVHFYRDVVGLPLLHGHGHPPALDLGHGACLAIVHGRPATAQAPGGSPFPALAFAISDLAEALQVLDHHGVDLPWGVETGAGARWVKFYDPAGNLIEFAQFDRQPA